MSLTKTEFAAYLTAHGLVVEGDETRDELAEAYRYLREHLREQTARLAA